MADYDRDNGSMPSLRGTFPRADISTALTTAGLLPDRSAQLVLLYSESLSWERAAHLWHEERRGNRGSRESAQKIFHHIRNRLNSGGSSLPTLRQLAGLLTKTSSSRARAQILYLYLVESDALVRFVLHELFRDQGINRSRWTLTKMRIRCYLNEFTYSDGSSLEYADSSLNRWAEGFRSVLREIGVREGKYADQGKTPPLSDVPLAVAAGYSWRHGNGNWEQLPLGWMYLFQPEADWPSLRARLREFPAWEESRTPRGNYLRPSGDPFAPEQVRR